MKNFPCENKEQLNKREGEIIREIGTLNKKIAGRTQKEYIEDNKDKIKEYKKEYQEKHIFYYVLAAVFASCFYVLKSLLHV
jgi:hypothetical protein